MRDFKKYTVWEQSHSLTLAIYQMTKSYPSDEKFGIISQMRRAASSIPTNIAEGCGKSSDKDFARFLNISFGSASELEYLLILSRDLEYISVNHFEKITGELISIKKQLYHLINKLNT